MKQDEDDENVNMNKISLNEFRSQLSPSPNSNSPPPIYADIEVVRPATLTSYRDHLDSLASRYQIRWSYLNRLEKLTSFRIVLVIDDSTLRMVDNSSLTRPNQNEVNPNSINYSLIHSFSSLKKVTKWNELTRFVQITVDVANIFDATNGADVYFMNRGTVRGIRSSRRVPEIMSRPAQTSGHSHLSHILFTQLDTSSMVDQESNLLVVVCIDVDTLEPSMSEMKSWLLVRPANVHVSLVMNSSMVGDNTEEKNDSVVCDLIQWSRRLSQVSIVGDYRSEISELLQLRAMRTTRHTSKSSSSTSEVITYDDYVVRALLSSVDSSMNNLVDVSCCSIL